MSEDLWESIDRATVLGVEPGDTLVMHIDKPLTQQKADEIKKLIRAQLSVDVPVLIVPKDCSFSVVRPVAT